MTGIFLFLGSFGLYLFTLPGTIPAYRDSGDMINAVFTLGIAHPPGYPLYVLLGKLFTVFLPFATAAFRVTLCSALFAAGTVAVFYSLARRLTGAPAALGAAVLLGLSPALLSLARVSEMYTMAAFFGSGIIACCALNTPRSLLLGSFLLGCGFGVHPTLLFLAPLLATFRRAAFARLGFFLAGFSVVFFLWVRSGDGPVQNWGNPATLADLWRVLTRSNYGGLKLHPVESQFAWTLGGLAAQGSHFFQTFLGQWGGVGLLAGTFGLFMSFQMPDRLAATVRLFGCWFLAGPFFFALSNLPVEQRTTAPILEPYLILVNLIWAVWLAQGIGAAARWIRAPALRWVLLGVLLIPSLVQARSSFRSYRDHFYAYDLGRNMLKTLPPRAVLYDPDDPVAFTLRGMQLLENRRNDVALLNFFRTYWGYRQMVDRWPDLLPPVPYRNAQELESAFWNYACKRRPCYVDLPVKLPPGISYRVEGLLYPIELAASPPTPEELRRAELRYPLYAWRGSWRTPRHPDFFTRQILNYRAAAHCNLGLKYAERREWEAARAHYQRALSIDPLLSVAYNNLGVADFEQRRYDRAVDNYRLALLYDPGNAGYQRNLEIAKQAKEMSSFPRKRALNTSGGPVRQ